MPTGCAVGQSVLDHHTHSQIDDPVGVVTAGWSQVGEIGREVPAAVSATMLGVNDDQIDGMPALQGAEVMEFAAADIVVISRPTAPVATSAAVVARAVSQMRARQVFHTGNPLSGVGGVA